MQSQLSRYIVLAKRWAWLIVLGILVCGGGTYFVTKHMHPVYQASAYMYLTMGSPATAPYENTSAGLAALPTYATLVTNPLVLNSVVAQHKGMTLDQLNNMLAVKSLSNQLLIEVDVKNSDPRLAAQLANQVSASFAHYVDTQLPASVTILPAVPPTLPVSPKPSQDALLGALAGLGLALALIVVFEWIDDRPGSPEEVQEISGVETLAIIPRLSRRELKKDAEEVPALAEGISMLCAHLNAVQAMKPFKLVMVTSALAGEGRSTVAANLAAFLAMTGKQVLFVDADLRHPDSQEYFQTDNRQGLTSLFMKLWSGLEIEPDGQPTDIPTLRVLPAGPVSSNPAELLQSAKAPQVFEHFQKLPFDYVIFDTSPLLPVADAQILASYVQATVLVVDVSKTPRKLLLRARRQLNKTRTTVIGTVLNKSRWPDSGAIQEYLDKTRLPARSMDLTVPPQTPPISRDLISRDIAAAETQLLNGSVDSDVTIVVSRPQKGQDKKL